MNANLMGAPSFRKHSQSGISIKAFGHFVKRPRVAACRMASANRHLLSMGAMSANRLFDHITIPIDGSRDDREVLLLDRSSFKLCGEGQMRPILLCHHHDARRVAIKAMDNS